MTTCRNNNNIHNIGRVKCGRSGGRSESVRACVRACRCVSGVLVVEGWVDVFILQILWPSPSVLNIAGTQTAFHNIVLPSLSGPPSLFPSFPPSLSPSFSPFFAPASCVFFFFFSFFRRSGGRPLSPDAGLHAAFVHRCLPFV